MLDQICVSVDRQAIRYRGLIQSASASHRALGALHGSLDSPLIVLQSACVCFLGASRRAEFREECARAVQRSELAEPRGTGSNWRARAETYPLREDESFAFCHRIPMAYTTVALRSRLLQ